MTAHQPNGSPDPSTGPPRSTADGAPASVDETNVHTNRPDASDSSADSTVWRAGYDRVRTGPLRAQNDTA